MVLLALIALLAAPDDTAALQRLVNGGGEITLDGRTYHLSAPLVLPSRTTLHGNGATLVFALPTERYGVELAPGAEDVRLENLTLRGGGVGMYQGERYRDVAILHCTIADSKMPGVYASIDSVGLRIEGCRFQDLTDTAIRLYDVDRCTIRGNTFLRVFQGMHVLNPHDDVVIDDNHGRQLHRMGIEIQQLDEKSPTTSRLRVTNNSFADWRKPFYDSFGLSVMAMRSIDTVVSGNTLIATYEGPRGPTNDNGNLFGYGIEAGFTTGRVEGNVVAGPFWYGIIVATEGARVERNRVIGVEAGHEIGGEVGGFAAESDNVREPMGSLPTTRAVDEIGR